MDAVAVGVDLLGQRIAEHNRRCQLQIDDVDRAAAVQIGGLDPV